MHFSRRHAFLSHFTSKIDPPAAALFLALATLACVMPAQTDTWWLLRSGEEMWRTKQILLHDTFTHTVAGQYWPNHEWLSQLLFFATYTVGGLPLLTALCAAAVICAWAIVYRITPGDGIERALMVGCAAAFSTAGWSLRPQVFTLALFAIVLALLVRRARLRLLPWLFLLWANLHGGVAVGGLLIVAALTAMALVERRIDRTLLIVAGLCAAATAATPLGWTLWIEVPKSLQRLKTYDVIEWRAPGLTNPADLPFWLALASAMVLGVLRRDRLREWGTALLAVAAGLTAVLALRSARNEVFFFVCVVPLAGRLLTSARASTASAPRPARSSAGPAAIATLGFAAVAAGAFITYAWSAPLARLGWHPVSQQMTAALDACHGPLYNRYDEGGYLIWFARNHKVFIDSRQDPFPESLVLAQLAIENTGAYQPTFGRYGIACALTPDRSRLAERLAADGWQRHDAGEGWVVYTRPSIAS